ncbi:hypothetical protein EI555_012738, partial [Monodon monoceros]
MEKTVDKRQASPLGGWQQAVLDVRVAQAEQPPAEGPVGVRVRRLELDYKQLFEQGKRKLVHEKVTEIYQFKFKYTKEGATMDFDRFSVLYVIEKYAVFLCGYSSSTTFESGTNSEDVKKASVLLMRKLYMMMQNLGPLPNDVILTMKLHYYNAVTPHNYHPPGFKEGVNSHFLLFEGKPVNLQAGLVSTGFHSMKLKVTTEVTRVSDLENRVFQESSTTEIAHQGLDCDEEEEEEECNN